MKKKLIGALTIALAGTLALGLAACGGDGDTPEVHDDIVNGGFEQGFTGWTKSGTAFSQGGVVDTNKAGPTGEAAGMAGKYFFSGYDSGNPQFTGTLTSDPFVLGGTGKVGFLMGGGMNGDKCYIEFFEQGNDTALLKVSNEAFALGYVTDQMVRVVADLSAHVGKTIYIKITDDDKGDADEYAYLNLDDFVVYKTAEEVTAAEKERADKLAAIGKPAFSETETDTTIKNGGFEEGLVNWLMLDGNAFGFRALCSDELFWANPEAEATATTNRPYNKEGNNFLNTYFDESATGSIRSTKFTLAGDGIISFLMAGAKNKGSYVALCDGTTNEELVKVTFDKYFSDPNLSENMVRHYIDAKEYMGKVLYIKVVDGEKSEFAGICVDDFKVSQTKEEIAEQMKADYERSCTVAVPTVAEAEQSYYSGYPYPQGCQLAVLRFDQKIAPQAAKAGVVDLTAYLAGAKAAYPDTEESDFAYAITGVTKDGAAVEVTNFAQANLGVGLYTVSYTVTYQSAVLSETFLLDISDANHVMNGGFETGNLAGWTNSFTQNAVISAQTYWGENLPYNQSGNYHLDGWNTGIDEGATWSITSSDFVLGGAGIITVKMGGHAAAVKVYCREDGSTYQVGYYKQARFEDKDYPHVKSDAEDGGGAWADMATYIIDLKDYIGKTLYIELCDEAVEGWAHAFFDEVVTFYESTVTVGSLKGNKDTFKDSTAVADDQNQSAQGQDIEVSWIEAVNETPAGELIVSKSPAYCEIPSADIAEFDLTAWIKSNLEANVVGVQDAEIVVTVTSVKEGDVDKTQGFKPEAGKKYTVTYTVSSEEVSGEPKEFTLTLNALHEGQIKNGGFETGDMTGWTTETEGFKTDTAVIGDATYWGEELPYNQSGNYHLDGWKTGIDEAGTWSVKSETFVLGGAGIITVKMGGRAAAVKVYEVQDDGTETLIGYYKQSRSIDPQGAFPHVTTEGGWADMATYVIDLSTYKNKTLRIELCDEAVEGGWAHAFFDEVITYYAEGTAAEELLQNKDKVTNGHGGEGNVQATEVELDWVSATNSYTAPADDTAD